MRSPTPYVLCCNFSLTLLLPSFPSERADQTTPSERRRLMHVSRGVLSVSRQREWALEAQVLAPRPPFHIIHLFPSRGNSLLSLHLRRGCAGAICLRRARPSPRGDHAEDPKRKLVARCPLRTPSPLPPTRSMQEAVPLLLPHWTATLGRLEGLHLLPSFGTSILIENSGKRRKTDLDEERPHEGRSWMADEGDGQREQDA